MHGSECGERRVRVVFPCCSLQEAKGGGGQPGGPLPRGGVLARLGAGGLKKLKNKNASLRACVSYVLKQALTESLCGVLAGVGAGHWGVEKGGVGGRVTYTLWGGGVQDVWVGVGGGGGAESQRGGGGGEATSAVCS